MDRFSLSVIRVAGMAVVLAVALAVILTSFYFLGSATHTQHAFAVQVSSPSHGSTSARSTFQTKNHKHRAVFRYELAGGLPATTQYKITVFQDGTLSAATKGLPITKAAKLTERTYSTHLSHGEVARIVSLAARARTFVKNPGKPWPDCRFAKLTVIVGKHRRTEISRRSGCIGKHWRQRKDVSALLQELAKSVPEDVKHGL